ncbi:MAG: hypothetical protein IPL38_02300 [Rhodobacter sp.]|jgi:hypothetical protein|nr:hypothetical protein [Rhodobacter sp.]MBK8438361.1 hypothetical protein [Rhodobacter sp.]
MRGPSLACLSLLWASAATAEIDVPRKADCLLVVQAEKLIGGSCMFTALDADGSFSISSLNGQFFAYVLVDRPGVARGYWNGAPYAGHAHDPLGQLRRDDACWVNDVASVCAW